MKFAHMADCHIGSYRDEKMRALSLEAFKQSIDKVIQEQVDFLLISGDLFNTSLPSVDVLKVATSKLKTLFDKHIPVYIIAGSHDFSPSGKTMLDVLENAGLCINVVKGTVNDEGSLQLQFTTDPKTGVKITGMIGKKGVLEKTYYESLDAKNLEDESGFKIFMFHSAITELKRKGMENMDSTPMSYLPKNFNYYAGGHVHDPLMESSPELGGVITYPGPLFPNSFKELADLKQGGFYIFDTDSQDLLTFVPIILKEVLSIIIDANEKTVEEVMFEIQAITKKDVLDKLVLLRIKGKLASGTVADINLKEFFSTLYDNGAYFVMRNTSALTSVVFEEITITNESLFDLEDKLVEEHIGQMNFEQLSWDKATEKKQISQLLELLDVEKQEGESQKDFEERITENVDILKLF